MKKNLSAVQLDLGTAETSNIKVSTNRMVLSFEGRGLSVRCISGSCVEIEGFITKIEFIS